MNNVIRFLKAEIERELNRLIEYETNNSGDYAYIEEIKEGIHEFRSAICVLKYFTVEELLDELLKRKK